VAGRRLPAILFSCGDAKLPLVSGLVGKNQKASRFKQQRFPAAIRQMLQIHHAA
jgi:hypothetical protein